MNTRTLAFEGHEDAHVIAYGIDGDEGWLNTFDAYNGAQLHLESPTESLRLTFTLDRDTGCWTIGFGPTSEAATVPAWPLVMGPGSTDYTGRLTVTVPDDTRIHEVTA
jgi:hypothetical protein